MSAMAVPDTAGVVAPPPLLYAGTFLAVLVLRRLWPMPILPGGGGLWPGIALAVGALIFGSWGRKTLADAGTDVNPYQPTTKIVDRGPYRLTRNPLYVALAATYLGLTFACNSAWGLILFVPLALVMHAGVILREERYLEGKFGDAYRAYQTRVRRYI